MPPDAPHRGTPETVDGTSAPATSPPIEITVPATVTLQIPPMAPVTVQAQIKVAPQRSAPSSPPCTPCEQPLAPHGNGHSEHRSSKLPWAIAALAAAGIAFCIGRESRSDDAPNGGAEYQNLPKSRINISGTSTVNSDGTVNIEINTIDGKAADNNSVRAKVNGTNDEGNGVYRSTVTITVGNLTYRIVSPEGGLGTVDAINGQVYTWSGIADRQDPDRSFQY